jgi:2-keto-3-deoxy-L-rhamnonate aldolase RhmA
LLKQLLDIGSQSFVVLMVESAAQATELVRAVPLSLLTRNAGGTATRCHLACS